MWGAIPDPMGHRSAHLGHRSATAQKVPHFPAERRPTQNGIAPPTSQRNQCPTSTGIRMFASRVAFTAHKLGIPPSEVLRKAVKGEIPLLSLGAGAAALTSLSSQSGEEQEQF